MKKTVATLAFAAVAILGAAAPAAAAKPVHAEKNSPSYWQSGTSECVIDRVPERRKVVHPARARIRERSTPTWC